jgi:SPP1 family predicted phage head-tail adaptor
VIIEKKTLVQDALGFPTETWTTVATVWGELKEDKGKEILQNGADAGANGRIVAFRRGLVYLRYRSDITSQHRLRVSGATWEIESLRKLENNRRTEGLELVVRAND